MTDGCVHADLRGRQPHPYDRGQLVPGRRPPAHEDLARWTPASTRSSRSPENNIFKVVFFPDRIYHAQYLNATRSPRYRYNVTEVRSEVDITVLKGEVYLDGKFLCNVLRIEYRAGRLVEQAREKDRFLRGELMADIDILPEGAGQPVEGHRQALLRRVDRRLPGRDLGDPGATPDRRRTTSRCST